MHPERIAKAPSASQSIVSGMPDDLLAESVQRLAWVGLTYSVCYAAVDRAYRLSAQIKDFPFFDAMLVLGLTMGCLIFAMARWSRWPAHRILAAGLIFEVLAAALISLGEAHRPWTGHSEVRGFSGLCGWIPMFSMLVPAGRLPSAIATLAAAATLPAAFAAHAWFGWPWPPAEDLLLLWMPPFLFAGAGIFLSQSLYRLRMRVRQAQEMGSYRLLECIGQGGMGEVWRAEHRMLARQAAIKLIKQQTGDPIQTRLRFEREAKAISGLQSPHTVTLFDYGVTPEGSLYYAMELVKGLDMEELVKRYGPLPSARAAYLLCQVCASLAEAHAAGLHHRDIKPRNILVGRMGIECDFVKVLDFGLVKSTAPQDLELTHPGATMGTPAYMAPEASLAVQPDHRADLYAVGCVAYWLLTGSAVFEAKTTTAMLMQHARRQPVPPSARTEVPVRPDLERLILQCLAKQPAERPQSAEELRERFQSLAHGWTREDASRWWNVHQPARSKIDPVADLTATA